jgi:hypothetical protein
MKNFGTLKNIFNDILAEGVSNKNNDKKNIFKKYVKMLKENEVLKTQFSVYTTIENMIEENQFKASEKIKKILESIKDFNEDVILEANSKLAKLIDEIDGDKEYEKKDLHENITNLIFSKDVDTYVDALNEAVEYVKTNTPKQIVETAGIPNKIFAPLAVGKFNDKYAELDESMKKTIKTIINADDEGRVELFNESVSDCLNLINEKLKDTDLTIKESLLAAKENLLERKYNSETFIKDITKILNLKSDLY